MFFSNSIVVCFLIFTIMLSKKYFNLINLISLNISNFKLGKFFSLIRVFFQKIIILELLKDVNHLDISNFIQ